MEETEGKEEVEKREKDIVRELERGEKGELALISFRRI